MLLWVLGESLVRCALCVACACACVREGAGWRVLGDVLAGWLVVIVLRVAVSVKVPCVPLAARHGRFVARGRFLSALESLDRASLVPLCSLCACREDGATNCRVPAFVRVGFSAPRLLRPGATRGVWGSVGHVARCHRKFDRDADRRHDWRKGVPVSDRV